MDDVVPVAGGGTVSDVLASHAVGHGPPLWQGIAGFALLIVPVAVSLALVRAGRVDRLDAAAGLVWWGVFIVVLEHVGFGLGEGFVTERWVEHARLHLQMSAVYGVAGLLLIAVVAATLLRERRRVGWYALAGAFGIGMLGEAVTAATIGFHGAPRQFWSWGLALWAYPIAWITALSLSYGPIVSRGARPPHRTRS